MRELETPHPCPTFQSSDGPDCFNRLLAPSAERKFAVGSGASCVAVCSYDESQNWWTSKVVRKHRSTVLTVAWHPTAPILATGASDFRCRVFWAYVKDVDSK